MKTNVHVWLNLAYFFLEWNMFPTKISVKTKHKFMFINFFPKIVPFMRPFFLFLSFRSCDSCRRLPEPKHHSFLFNHWCASKCLVFMAARTSSIHVFLGRLLFLLSPAIPSIINIGSLSSCILLTWPYHWSLFLSMMSIISGFSFTPIISFIYEIICKTLQ